MERREDSRIQILQDNRTIIPGRDPPCRPKTLLSRLCQLSRSGSRDRNTQIGSSTRVSSGGAKRGTWARISRAPASREIVRQAPKIPILRSPVLRSNYVRFARAGTRNTTYHAAHPALTNLYAVLVHHISHDQTLAVRAEEGFSTDARTPVAGQCRIGRDMDDFKKQNITLWLPERRAPQFRPRVWTFRAPIASCLGPVE